MKSLLVVIVMNSPVKTDLTCGTLAECLAAEGQMRKEWAEHYSRMQKAGTEREALGLLSSQMTKGACVPSK